MIVFDSKQFLLNKYSVACDCKQASELFLDYLDDQTSIMWSGGGTPTHYNPHDEDHDEDDTLYFEMISSYMVYGDSPANPDYNFDQIIFLYPNKILYDYQEYFKHAHFSYKTMYGHLKGRSKRPPEPTFDIIHSTNLLILYYGNHFFIMDVHKKEMFYYVHKNAETLQLTHQLGAYIKLYLEAKDYEC